MSKENKHDVTHLVYSSLATLYLKEASKKGKTIEIPSLGIRIKPEKKKK